MSNILYKKFDEYLIANKLSRYQLCKLIDCRESTISQMTTGKRAFSEKLIEKIILIIGVSREEFESWLVADKYSKEIIKSAIKAKEMHTSEKLILTTKIDEILQSKNLSRTALSKIIDYYQGKLNRMIIGKEPMSKLVISKIAPVFEVAEDVIKSWIVADKYSLHVLELAIKKK